MNLTWKDVLNSHVPYARWGHIEEFLPIVDITGYRFFSWNGRIYEIQKGRELTYRNTGLTEEDLE